MFLSRSWKVAWPTLLAPLCAVLLWSAPAAAGVAADPAVTNYAGVTLADYSWTQLLSLEDPAALDLLANLSSSGGFLMTGNAAYNGLGASQILVVGTAPLSTSGDLQSVPEPSIAILAGLMLLAGWLLLCPAGARVRLKVSIQREKLCRR